MRPVRFTETHDGLSLAWTRSGSGLPLVKASAWLTHLEYDAQSPIWAHWLGFFEGNFDYLRYDERGCGLSDRKTGTMNEESWIDDLERVVKAADLPKPFVLMAMSQGTGAAVGYAARHPEDVSHLIILGGYSRGVYKRDNPQAADFYTAITNVFRLGFDSGNTSASFQTAAPKRSHGSTNFARGPQHQRSARSFCRRGGIWMSRTFWIRCNARR